MSIQVGRNIVSSCCEAPVVTGTINEYPLGGTVWNIAYKSEICTKCDEPCLITDVCEGCGESTCEGSCCA